MTQKEFDWLQRLDLELSAAMIKELLEYAGRRIGIGDFRPEKGGPFGRFMVTAFKEQ